MKRALLAAAAALLVGAPAAAQTIAVTGGTVYPVTGAPIPNGTVLIQGGRIVAVGAGIAIPAGAQRIDATGKWVTPGLFESSTNLGSPRSRRSTRPTTSAWTRAASTRPGGGAFQRLRRHQPRSMVIRSRASPA